MNNLKLIFLFSFLVFTQLLFAGKADHLVIAEVYGGGGNSGSYYKYDYIILYNPTSQSVNLSSWSVQYASATGHSWNVTNLSGTISSDSYYSIEEGSGGDGNELPFIPNDIGSKNMNATHGKVALVNDLTGLTGDKPLSDGDVNIVDFVGYGSDASDYEGSNAAPSPSNTKSIRRKDNNGNETFGTNGSGWDTDVNSADFDTVSLSSIVLPLPVELSSFTISQNNNSIILNWETETEVNNYGFEVERSQESENRNQKSKWEKIGFVKGTDNSNSPNSYSFVDKNPLIGKIGYRLEQTDNDGTIKYSSVLTVNSLSTKFELYQNYPNPFNPTTTIQYTISKSEHITLKVYDELGKEVKILVDENRTAGQYNVQFDGSDLASGIYYYDMTAGGFNEVKKLLLLK